MKTNKLSVLLLAYCVILSGCRKQTPTIFTEDTASPNTIHTETVATTETTEATVVEEQLPTAETLATESAETSGAAETEPSTELETTKPTTAPTTPRKPTEPTVPTVPTKPTEPTNPTVPEEPTKPTTPTTPVTPTEPTETEPVTTEPAEPVTSPTKPAPTEPTGCTHDWVCIHHDEEGHWRAGVVCDCGWTVYGKASEVVSKWNAHSASFSSEESFLNHGGYGSVDEWIVDKPAYDEWVCRHCAEVKS